MATTFTNEAKSDPITTANTLLIDSTYELLIDSTYKLEIQSAATGVTWSNATKN